MIDAISEIIFSRLMQTGSGHLLSKNVVGKNQYHFFRQIRNILSIKNKSIAMDVLFCCIIGGSLKNHLKKLAGL